MNSKRILFTFLLILAQGAHAAMVDTVVTHSEAMNKNIKAVVITPDNAGQRLLPVLYLLHGYGGNYADWIKKVPELSQYADQYQLIIVCPDGAIGSWYWDSPIDKGFRYETYVATELVNWVDTHYKTRANRNGRAITGLSMGGQGALYLGFRHQDVFGAAGSMSGGVDIRPFPNNWDMAKRLGSYAENPALWESYTLVNQIHLLTPNSLALTIDCGTSDFFYGVNENLHTKLLERNIPHDYTTRPGAHTWEYWSNSITFQLVFFSHFFNQAAV